MKQAKATRWKPTARSAALGAPEDGGCRLGIHRCRARRRVGVGSRGRARAAPCRALDASTRPCPSSPSPSVPPGPATRRSARRLPMIGVVPDDRRCIVIGAGLLGLATAWAMTRRGWQVLVLEAAAAPGHEGSGSKGDARIFRLGYPDPLYVEMAVLARARWRDLEGGGGATAPPRHRPGDVGRGEHVGGHRRRARRRRCAPRACPGPHRGAAPARYRRHGHGARRARLGRAGRRPVPRARCATQPTSRSARAATVTSLRQSPDSVTVRTRDGSDAAGGHRRRLRRPGQPRARRRRLGGGGGPPVAPPGGLLRPPARCRGRPACLHRMGGRHGLRLARPAGWATRRARTRWPSTCRARPLRPSIRPIRSRSPPTTRPSSPR